MCVCNFSEIKEKHINQKHILPELKNKSTTEDGKNETALMCVAYVFTSSEFIQNS